MSVARQLELSFDAAPRDADELLARLRALGLRDTDRVRLTGNRSVMVGLGWGTARATFTRIRCSFGQCRRDVAGSVGRLRTLPAMNHREQAERRSAKKGKPYVHVRAGVAQPARGRKRAIPKLTSGATVGRFGARRPLSHR